MRFLTRFQITGNFLIPVKLDWESPISLHLTSSVLDAEDSEIQDHNLLPKVYTVFHNWL